MFSTYKLMKHEEYLETFSRRTAMNSAVCLQGMTVDMMQSLVTRPGWSVVSGQW